MPNTEGNRGLKLVAIGGGTGLSTLLAGLKKFVGEHVDGAWLESLSAIVTVSDDGGSSGRLREELQMLPPGDIRNCMIALSEDSTLLAGLFQYRFGGSGDLAGHSFGNLFLAALTEVTGDFAEAVRLSSEVLASKGHIYPATITDVRLVAELEDGTEVHGETQITGACARIRRLRLEPEECLPLPKALAAIEDADVITIGPGSLYTSILPNLLITRIANAIGESKAIKIFVTNLMTQPGETDGYDMKRHLQTVKSYAPQIKFDCMIVNSRPISEEQAALYGADGAYQVKLDNFDKAALDTEVISVDLLDEADMVRHNSDRLGQAVLVCATKACDRLPVLVEV